MKSSAYCRYLNIIAKTSVPTWQKRPLSRPAQPGVQPFAHPSISRHGLSRRDRPLKSTRFYYPAKIFRLLSTTVMTMIRNLALSPDRRDVRIVRALLMQAPR